MLDYNNQSMWKNNFGAQQSPVALNRSDANVDLQSFSYSIESDYILNRLIDDETTIRLTGNGSAKIINRDFSFQQVHFHSPSEHTIDNAQFPFEIHLVHQNAIGQLLVIALMVTLGSADPQFEQILNKFQRGQHQDVQIDITDWLNFNAKHGFHYLGSLTTPPLTEGVEWIVISNSQITISSEQLSRYQAIFNANNRSLQSLNDRKLFYF